MNKSTLISTINGYLTALITQAKVRLASLELINVLFSPIVNNTKSSTSLTPLSITTPLNANLDYNLNFKKEGNKVFIEGFVLNSSDSETIAGVSILEITSSTYLAKTGITQPINSISEFGDGTILFVSGQFIYLSGFTPVFPSSTMSGTSSYVYINSFYYTND